MRARLEAAAQLFPNRVAVDFPTAEAIGPVFMREVGDVHRDLYATHGDLYGENIAGKIERCLAITDGESRGAQHARREHAERAASALDGCDLLLTPTLAFVAPPADVDEPEVRGELHASSPSRSTRSAGRRSRCRAEQPRTGCPRRCRSSAGAAPTRSCWPRAQPLEGALKP